jgi:hypothetical protein
MVEVQPTLNRDVRSMLMPHTYELQRSFIPYRPSLLEPALIFRISLFVFFENFFSPYIYNSQIETTDPFTFEVKQKKKFSVVYALTEIRNFSM